MDIKVTETAKSRLYDMGISDNIFLRIGVKSRVQEILTMQY